MSNTTTLATGISTTTPVNSTQTMRVELNAEIVALKQMVQAWYDRDNTWVTIDNTFDEITGATAATLHLNLVGLIAAGFYTTRDIPVVGRINFSGTVETITAITGGQDGMILIIKVDDASAANLVITDNAATIMHSTGANVTMTPGDIMVLTYQDAIWSQVCATLVE